MADEVTPIQAEPTAPTADYSGFAERMNSAVNEPAAASTPEPVAQPAADAPVTPEAAVPEAPKPAEAAPAFNESEWLASQFGDKYKTPAEVKAELEQAETLRQSQLTDEHKRSLALLSDADTRREYLRLADADYTTMDPVQAMRENFARKNPQFDAEEAAILFDKQLNEKFGAAYGIDPEHPDFEDSPEYRADKLLMDKQAERDRAELSQHRDQRTAELLAGVPVADKAPEGEPAAATITPEVQAELDTHYAKVGDLVKAPLDIQVELPDGQKVSIKARETPEDIQAAEEVMRDPFGSFNNFLYPDGKTLDYDALELFTAFRTQGSKLFANAVAIGRDSVPPHVTLDGLTNGGTAHATPAAVTNDPAGFAARLAAQQNHG